MFGSSLPVPISASALAFVTLCMLSDVRTRRIPNAMCAPGMALGVALNAAYFGVSGLVGSVAGLIAIVAVLLAPFALGGIGGGDVKMMGAVGALLGVQRGIAALAIGLVLGGAVMMIHLARRGRLREKLEAVGTMVSAAVVVGSVDPLRVSAADQHAVALPYSVPLGVGTLAALMLTGNAFVR